MSKVMTRQNKRKLGESKRERLSFVWSLEEEEDNCQHLYHLDTSYFNYAKRQSPVTQTEIQHKAIMLVPITRWNGFPFLSFSNTVGMFNTFCLESQPNDASGLESPESGQQWHL